ncbi:hypothetical protein ACFE04_028095 [Oxalis oulophora]
MQELRERMHLACPCLILITLVIALHLIASPQFRLVIDPPITLTPPTVNSSTTSTTSKISPIIENQCPNGKIFVYQLPFMFNIHLLQNCHGLDPWRSFCAPISNHGFGPPTDNLVGVVPDNLLPTWHKTNQLSLEVIFHHRLLHHHCRTLEPQSATAFYIPFYAGLAVNKFLWYDCTSEEKDHLPKMLLKWLKNQKYFKRFNGSDHFISLGRITWDHKRSSGHGWGSSFLKMPGMKNVLRFLIEADPWDTQHEIGVPYPIGFHPRSNGDVLEWQNFVRTQNRTFLLSFVGGKRAAFKNDFKGILTSQCVNNSLCKLVDCGGLADCHDKKPWILEASLDSDFCLQPSEDSYTRRSVFDCMVAGSIPIFFWNRTYDHYKWFLPSEPESYSIFIDYDELKKNGFSSINISKILEMYSREKVKKMRETVIDLIPKLVYANGNDVRDALDVGVNGILRKIKKIDSM